MTEDSEAQVPDAEKQGRTLRPEATESPPPGSILAARLREYARSFVGPMRRDLFAAAARLDNSPDSDNES